MDLVTYPAVLTTTENEYRIEFPDLPTANVVDHDLERAQLRARIGLALMIADRLSHFEPVPQPGTVALPDLATNQQAIAITTDLDQY